jgi:antitoxin component YwqK of YwqJK toxin-antitoxin module
MKLFLIAILSMFTISVSAQITSAKEQKKCYLKYDDNDVEIKGKPRYSAWECGKLAGVVDCNQRLEFHESSDMIYLKNDDLVNAAGGNKPFTGTCETCHMNGTLERRVSFVNGKQNGIDTTKYQSGCMQVIRNHIQGVESGQWLYYYDSTQMLAWEMNYMMGQLHGRQMYFKENGDTTKSETYENGVLHGIKRTYYPYNKIKNEVNYNHGVFEGKFKIYNRDGVVIEELNYLQGKKDDECKYFYDDGKPLKIEHWSAGVKNGEFKMFFYDGSTQTSENYKKGLKEGVFEEFYPDAKTKHKRVFKKDVLIEEYKYDEHGRETYAFPERIQTDEEDDAAPTMGDDKKKKKNK